MFFYALSVAFIVIIFENVGFCQLKYDKIFLQHVDEPFQFLPQLKTGHYHQMSIYNCQDSVYVKGKCRCTEKEIINDSGRVIKAVFGSDIEKDKIDYTINYVSVTDSVCIIMTRYSTKYIDSTMAFTYDTTVRNQNKKVHIYERESNGNVIIKSVLKYNSGSNHNLPDTSFRYDRTGKLKAIYYPNGSRQPILEWKDSSSTSNTKSNFFNEIYKENEFHQYKIQNLKGLILEDGYSNIGIPDKINSDLRRSIYIYDDSSRIIAKYTVGENNRFLEEERFTYCNNYLSKYTEKFNLADTIENVRELYDSLGQVIEKFSRNDGYPLHTWRYIYTYSGALQQKTACYLNGRNLWNCFFFYN